VTRLLALIGLLLVYPLRAYERFSRKPGMSDADVVASLYITPKR
jgi:hypothetical protein